MKKMLSMLRKIFSRRSQKSWETKKRKGHATAEEAREWKNTLAKYYRRKFGVEMHPLQSDPSIVPTLEVALSVQAPNKCNPDTFFATGYRQTIDYLEELAERGLHPDRMKAILEFGVGTGRLLTHYLPFKAKLYGCDVNPIASKWTQKALGHRAEIHQNQPDPPLPYPTGAFDYIYANSVFTHIPFEKHEAWVAELSRLLAPGGCLIATVHSFDKVREYNAPDGWFERNSQKGLHRNTYFSEERLLGIWRPYFDTLEVRPYAVQTHVIAMKKAPAKSETAFVKTQSILHKARAIDVVKEPFPHLVIREALDPDLFARLEAEFPAHDIVMDKKPLGNNTKYFYGAVKSLANKEVTPLWKDFIRTHLSDSFYQEVIALFEKDIHALYPDLENRLKKNIRDLKTGIRRFDLSAEAMMDCQFAVNSPVQENSSSVRGPHVDGADTLFQCLLYFRNEGDNAGGDLELYRFKEGVDPATADLKAVDNTLVSKCKTVAYEKNTLIAFLNSPHSLHGVSPRKVTTHFRRYFDVLCDLPIRLYE